MLPEKHVWIFNGTGARFPAGAFTSRALAEEWIRARRLSGMLTAYPLDEGVFDWALRHDFVTGRARGRGDDPAFVGAISSATQEHYHSEDGASSDAAV